MTGLVHQPLYRGIEVVVMPSFDITVFCRSIQDQRITFAYVAPPVIVHLSRNDIVKRYDLSSLRMITSGAAPLTKELVDAVHRRLNLKINQAYGLSETSPMTHTQVRSSPMIVRNVSRAITYLLYSLGKNGIHPSVPWGSCSPI